MENTYPLPPGPKGLPLFGNVFQLGRDQLRFLLDVQRRYGRMATIHIGRTPVVLLFQPEHVRYILTENPRNFTNREVVGGLVFSKMLLFALLASTFSKKASEDLYQLIGDGLGTTDGAYHDRQRRLVQPSFSKQRVESYAAMIVQYTQEMMERWQPGMEMEMESEIQALVLRMIAKLLLNIDVLKEETNLAEIINGMTSNPI